MKLKIVSLLVVLSLLIGLFVPVVMAQGSPEEVESVGNGLDVDYILDLLFSGELPDTAVGLVGLAVGIILSIFGLGNLTEVFTNALKKLDWLKFIPVDKKAQIAGDMAEIVSLVVACLATWIAAQLITPIAQYVDSTGLWLVALSVWGYARNVYMKRKAQRYAFEPIVINEGQIEQEA